jgi:Na+/proline symporter
LSLVLDLNLTWTSLLIAGPAVIYTMFGGVQAVTWTDVKIMVLIVFGLFAVIATAVIGYPNEISIADSLTIAGAAGRLRTFDFSFDLTNQYTFWSGTIAALFLFCSYFGTDQSQVQRYLTARSADEARRSLLMSAYWKIPLQAIVLLVGILIFVFYVFHTPPLIFSDAAIGRLDAASRAKYENLQQQHDDVLGRRRDAAYNLAKARESGDAAQLQSARTEFRDRNRDLELVRLQARTLVRESSRDDTFDDVNYIVPRFILKQLPVGLVGLLILAILLAATDSIAGELNSLSTATVIDFYRRWARPTASDAHYLAVSKAATGLWGLFACAVAVWAAELGSLIEVVNRIGSFFYGSVLGVFILAIAFPRATGTGAFVGLIAGMALVASAAAFTDIAFLWHNVIGAVGVVVVGVLVSPFTHSKAS